MTRERRQRVATAGAVLALVALLLPALILAADYVSARRKAGGETARLEALQAQVQRDASATATIHAEFESITRARLARKARIDALAVVMMVAAAAFVASAQWRLALGSVRPTPPLLVPARIPLTPVAAAVAPPAGGEATAQMSVPGIDLAFVEEIVVREGTSREAAIPILQAIQAHYRYLPDAALRRVCELTDVTPAQIAGTSSFYARFRRTPVGRHVVRVCHGTACHVSGARQITEELRRQLCIPADGDTDPGREFTVDEVACVGCCSLAPVLMVEDRTTGRVTPATVGDALDRVRQKAAP
jgi:NADH:ubiquinone oxidoreductase subunit E